MLNQSEVSHVSEAGGESGTPPAPFGGSAPAAEVPVSQPLGPPPPRARQLMVLVDRIRVYEAQLEAIYHERKDEGAPVAERIMDLEDEEREAAEAIARTVETQVSLDDTIGEMEAELARLRGLREAAHEQAVELAQRRGRAAADLEAARAQFETIMFPRHYRHAQNKLRSLREKADKIVARHPEARLWRLEQAIEREIEASGLPARAAATVEAFRAPAFAEKFRQRLDALGEVRREQLVDIARAVVTEMGVDHDGVLIRAFVRQGGRIRWKVGGATPEARGRALAAIKARAAAAGSAPG